MFNVNYKYCWIGDDEPDDFDYGTSDGQENGEDRLQRYENNATHFKIRWPDRAKSLQKVIEDKKKLKGVSRSKERLDYLGFIRYACTNYFDAKQLVSKQKTKQKWKVWQAFKKSQFGPLRYCMHLLVAL
jgi:hypothetical protein